MKDLFSYHTVRSTRSCSTPPSYPFTQVGFASVAPLILPLEVHLSRNDISPLAASKTSIQRRVQRIETGSRHSKGGVNGFSVSVGFLLFKPLTFEAIFLELDITSNHLNY